MDIKDYAIKELKFRLWLMELAFKLYIHCSDEVRYGFYDEEEQKMMDETVTEYVIKVLQSPHLWQNQK